MPELTPLSVVLVALGLVVLINGFLLLTTARSGMRSQIRLLRRATTRASDPWGEERRALEELDRRVAELRPTDDDQEPADD